MQVLDGPAVVAKAGVGVRCRPVSGPAAVPGRARPAAAVRAHRSQRLGGAVPVAGRDGPRRLPGRIMGRPPHLEPGSFDLITQLGLLGPCRDVEHFTASFTHLHRLLTPGGWTAGANWVACHPEGRVERAEHLLRAHRRPRRRAPVHPDWGRSTRIRRKYRRPSSVTSTTRSTNARQDQTRHCAKGRGWGVAGSSRAAGRAPPLLRLDESGSGDAV